MRALTCPQCSAPLGRDPAACPYCGVGLVTDALPETRQDRTRNAAAAPDGWITHRDPWHGFSIVHPPEWRVETLRGAISVRLDPLGRTAASIYPFLLPQPATAQQVARWFAGLMRAGNPTFQSWIQSGVSERSRRVTVRTRQDLYGQQVEGVWNILVDGTSSSISGCSAPVGALGAQGEIMARILTTFAPMRALERMAAVDPTEGAFSVQLPAGWSFQGGVNRNTIGGAGMPYFWVAEGAAGAASCLPNQSWFFLEPLIGGLLGGYPVLGFMNAAAFCRHSIVPWMQQSQPLLEVITITERPDLADLMLADLARQGYSPAHFELSAALLETRYPENGTLFRQASRVVTQRQRGGGMAGAPGWMALLDVYYRAPDFQFAAVEAVLRGVLDSYQPNPAWQAAEQGRTNGILAASQADRQRRQQQISQTLQETSAIITSGYWGRQAAYERMSEQRSNATLGLQNVSTASGQVYQVPYGYDQYWQDGLGNVYGGNWGAQPDANWTPLHPTGI